MKTMRESTVCRRTSFAGELIGAACGACGHTNVAHGPEGCAVCLLLAPDLDRLRAWMNAVDDAMQVEGVPDEQRRRVTTRLLYGSSCLCMIDTRDSSIVDREDSCPTHGQFAARQSDQQLRKLPPGIDAGIPDLQERSWRGGVHGG